MAKYNYTQPATELQRFADMVEFPDAEPTENSAQLVTSGGVYDAIQAVEEEAKQLSYNSLMEDTASGSIASFPDGAENVPVKELTAEIEPIQDLHNLPFPYPDGGYKNRLPITATTQTVNGVTFTINKDAAGNVISVRVNGTATANTYFRLISYYALPAGSYILNGCPSGGSGTTFRISIYTNGGVYKTADVGSGAAFTVSEDYTAVYNDRCEIGITSGATCNNLVFYPMIRLSTEADATFAPYSNVCPIGGYTGAEITRAGDNLFDGTLYGGNWESGDFKQMSSYGSTVYKSLKVKVKAGNYTVSWGKAVNVTRIVKDGACTYVAVNNVTSQLIAAETDGYIGISWRDATSSSTAWDTTTPIKVEAGTTATPFDGYATVYSVSWTDHGTVYKGTAQYKGDGEWEITATYAGINVADATLGGGWALTDEYVLLSRNISARIDATKGQPKASMRRYSSTGLFYRCWQQNGGAIGLSFSRADLLANGYDGSTAASAISAAMAFEASLPSPDFIIYPLETPVTFTVSGPDPETLLGDNNIWSNTGDISVKYRCNTALYIEKKLGA